MPDEIRRIDYYYVSVPDEPGEAARILSALHQAGINLLGASAFPQCAGRSASCEQWSHVAGEELNRF